jgi:two-component system sensor histidine kinase/response regulator
MIVIRLAAVMSEEITPSLSVQAVTLFTSLLIAAGIMVVTSAYKKIIELENLREELTHFIVHDLQNPLAAILLANDLLLMGKSGQITEAQGKILESSQSSAKELLAMVLNILDAGKIESGKMALEKARFRTKELAEEVAWLKVEAENSGKRLEIEAGDFELEADLHLIKRVLENLLINAVRHTREGGRIRLSIKQQSNGGLFEVADEGEGIPKDDLPHIFEKFYKVERKTKKDTAGIGLGLLFCKLAVEAHGGWIKAESEPGQGSKFSFFLPG